MSTNEGPDQQPPTPAPAPGPQFNPQSAQPIQPGPVQPGQPYQYPAPPAGQAPYGQVPYGQPYPYPAPGWPGYQLPDHPKGNLAFILGLIAVPGAFATCGLAIFAAPFAWYYAVRARHDMRLAPGQYGGESKVTTGLVLGIIGTVLLVLGILLVILVAGFAIMDPGSFDSGTTV